MTLKSGGPSGSPPHPLISTPGIRQAPQPQPLGSPASSFQKNLGENPPEPRLHGGPTAEAVPTRAGAQRAPPARMEPRGGADAEPVSPPPRPAAGWGVGTARPASGATLRPGPPAPGPAAAPARRSSLTSCRQMRHVCPALRGHLLPPPRRRAPRPERRPPAGRPRRTGPGGAARAEVRQPGPGPGGSGPRGAERLGPLAGRSRGRAGPQCAPSRRRGGSGGPGIPARPPRAAALTCQYPRRAGTRR